MSDIAVLDVVDRVSRELVADDVGVDTTLDLVVSGLRAAVPTADGVAVRLVDGGPVRGDDDVAGLDRLALELGEGPGHDAVAAGAAVHVEDLSAAAGTWPRFAPAALATGVRALSAFPLAGRRGRPAGTLALAARTPGALAGPARHAGGLVAAYATIALERARRTDELQAALRSRDVIATAKGILVERFAVGPDEAFAMLRRSSQHTNLKLRDVAEWLVGETTGS